MIVCLVGWYGGCWCTVITDVIPIGSFVTLTGYAIDLISAVVC